MPPSAPPRWLQRSWETPWHSIYPTATSGNGSELPPLLAPLAGSRCQNDRSLAHGTFYNACTATAHSHMMCTCSLLDASAAPLRCLPCSYDWARTARLAAFNAGMGVLGHEYYRVLDGVSSAGVHTLIGPCLHDAHWGFVDRRYGLPVLSAPFCAACAATCVQVNICHSCQGLHRPVPVRPRLHCCLLFLQVLHRGTPQVRVHANVPCCWCAMCWPIMLVLSAG